MQPDSSRRVIALALVAGIITAVVFCLIGFYSVTMGVIPQPQALVTRPTVLVPVATRVPTTAAPPTRTRTPAPTPTDTPNPTLLPFLGSGTPGTSNDIPTITPMMTPTSGAFPTPVPRATTPVPVPPAPSGGVYVTSVSVSPPQPKRGEGVTFTATFVNSTGQNKSYRWFVFIYDLDGNQFGETAPSNITVPPGTSQFATPNNWKVGGPGACLNFTASAHMQDGTQRPAFPSTSGRPASVAFSVCP